MFVLKNFTQTIEFPFILILLFFFVCSNPLSLFSFTYFSILSTFLYDFILNRPIAPIFYSQAFFFFMYPNHIILEYYIDPFNHSIFLHLHLYKTLHIWYTHFHGLHHPLSFSTGFSQVTHFYWCVCTLSLTFFPHSCLICISDCR